MLGTVFTPGSTLSTILDPLAANAPYLQGSSLFEKTLRSQYNAMGIPAASINNAFGTVGLAESPFTMPPATLSSIPLGGGGASTALDALVNMAAQLKQQAPATAPAPAKAEEPKIETLPPTEVKSPAGAAAKATVEAEDIKAPAGNADDEKKPEWSQPLPTVTQKATVASPPPVQKREQKKNDDEEKYMGFTKSDLQRYIILSNIDRDDRLGYMLSSKMNTKQIETYFKLAKMDKDERKLIMFMAGLSKDDDKDKKVDKKDKDDDKDKKVDKKDKDDDKDKKVDKKDKD